MRIFLIIFAINPVIPEFVSLNQRHELQKYQKSSNLMMDQSEKVLRRKKRWDHYSHKVQENLKNREKINTVRLVFFFERTVNKICVPRTRTLILLEVMFPQR